VAGLGRMNEIGRCSGAGQRRRDLASDMAGLAHAADDYAAVAIQNQHQRLQEVTVDTIGKYQHGIGFDAQHLAGEVERFR